MKITVNWEKAWPAVFVAFLAGLPLLLIAGLIRWRLQWLKDYQAKLASQVGQLRNDTQLHTPKANPDRSDPRLTGGAVDSGYRSDLTHHAVKY